MEITGRQIRAARNLLGISADALARKVGVSAPALYRIEKKDTPSLTMRLCAELEASGIRFIGGGEDNGAIGVILQDSDGRQ